MTLPAGSEEHGQGDVVQFGGQARLYRRWPGSLLAVCLVVVAAVVVISPRDPHLGLSGLSQSAIRPADG
ncbi:MAG TPA: hypothetical protein VEV45_16780 [Streptosporangiaceae bacterium]|nr:hypothetical protein [Streptosporangiaceae bacterium]